MIIGMDFGTTNSVTAVYDKDDNRLEKGIDEAATLALSSRAHGGSYRPKEVEWLILVR
jgi:N-acetylglucosamine kinase-like BadF-type ATPase